MEMDMRSATILFSTPRQIQWWPLSFLVRFIQYRKRLIPFRFFGLYHSSHVSICLGEMVYESVFFLGVRKIPLMKWLEVNTVRKSRTIFLKEGDYRLGELYLDSSCGISYAFLELFGIFLAKFLKTFFKKELYGNPFKTVKPKMKCSELIYNYLKVVDRISGLKDPNLVDVPDIENILI